MRLFLYDKKQYSEYFQYLYLQVITTFVYSDVADSQKSNRVAGNQLIRLIIYEYQLTLYRMYFKQIFEPKLAQYAYLIGCQKSKEAIIIDPMRDVDQYFTLAKRENLKLVAAADTHIHADYVSGLQEMAERGVHVYASDEGDSDWKYNWLKDSDYAHTLLHNGDVITIGNIRLKAVHTPGHTPEHLSYELVDGAATDKPMGLLSGDFVFVGDVGRPDLLETAAGQAGAMKPSAQRLFQSLQFFKDLPDYMKVWPAHGAGSACGKALGAVPDSTVGYEKVVSTAIKLADSEEEFINFILDGQPEPPLYFARMKKVNRDGINVLGELPAPKAMQPEELIDRDDITVLDTRSIDEFMHLHLKNSLLSTWNKAFNTVAGSYIKPEEQIVLIIHSAHIEEAVRDLVRIGLDNVIGFVDVQAFTEWIHQAEKDHTSSIPTVKFSEFNPNNPENGKVLDVRKRSEWDETGHFKNARHIAHTRLLDRYEELDLNTRYYVHCEASGRASVATALLAKKGYNVVLIHDDIKQIDPSLLTKD